MTALSIAAVSRAALVWKTKYTVCTATPARLAIAAIGAPW